MIANILVNIALLFLTPPFFQPSVPSGLGLGGEPGKPLWIFDPPPGGRARGGRDVRQRNEAPTVVYSDPDTGIYLRADGSIGVVCDGVDRFTLDLGEAMKGLILGVEVRIYCDGEDRGTIDLDALCQILLEETSEPPPAAATSPESDDRPRGGPSGPAGA